MARRSRGMRLRIPGMKGGINNKQLMWGGLLGLGAVGLYFILANKDTGIPFADQLLEPVGDITGLEGKGPQLLPQLFPGDAAAKYGAGFDDMQFAGAGYGDWYGTGGEGDRILIA